MIQDIFDLFLYNFVGYFHRTFLHLVNAKSSAHVQFTVSMQCIVWSLQENINHRMGSTVTFRH